MALIIGGKRTRVKSFICFRHTAPAARSIWIAPLVAVIAVLLCGRLYDMRSAAESAGSPWRRSLPWVLKLLFFAYPIVSSVAFEAFACYEFTASSYLKADVAIECFSEAHTEVKTLAWVAILIYPVG